MNVSDSDILTLSVTWVSKYSQ